MKSEKEISLPNKKSLYKTLFFSTLYISAFTLGGGYVIIPMLRAKFVEELGWIAEDEMMNLVVIAQSSPGALAVNASMLVGYSIAGVTGAFITVVATILPPLVTISIISFVYDAFKSNPLVQAVLKGAQAGVSAVVAHVVIDMAKPFFANKQLFYIGIMLAVLFVSLFTNINVVFIILSVAVIGAAYTLYNQRRSKI